jgi:hypothetical protein
VRSILSFFFLLCFRVYPRQVLNIPKLYALGLEHVELLDEQQELVGWVHVHKVCGGKMKSIIFVCLFKEKF